MTRTVLFFIPFEKDGITGLALVKKTDRHTIDHYVWEQCSRSFAEASRPQVKELTVHKAAQRLKKEVLPPGTTIEGLLSEFTNERDRRLAV